MADSLSIEEMNRTRAALGMPLLPVPSSNSSASNLDFKKSSSKDGAEAEDDSSDDDDPGSTLETREAAASDNWQKLQSEANDKKQREERRAALKKERDAAQRFARLEGKTLGEGKGENSAVDTAAWLLGSDKRQKKIAKERSRMLQRELEERERLAQTQYSESDLAGKKVGHEVGDFEEGEQILTLKDAAVDDEDEEDELENMDLREREKLNERLKLKSRKAVYDPNAEDETGERSILGQYDEEIDGKKKNKKRFTLDGQGRTEEEAKAASSGQDTNGPHRVRFNLDFLEETKPTSDYLDVSEIKVKKSKKKKDKTKRQRRAEEDDDDIFAGSERSAPVPDTATNGAMDIEQPQINGRSEKRPREDSAFGDDEDLQSHLARQRRMAFKKRKLARPEDIARQLRDEASATPDPDAMNTDDNKQEPDAEDGGLIIDETSEFVANLQKSQTEERERRRETSSRPPISQNRTPLSATPGRESDGDVEMEQRNGKDSESEDEQEETHRSDSREFSEISTPVPGDSQTATGLKDEETLNNSGIGATLGMLTQRGLLKANNGDELNKSYSHQTEFIKHKERLEKEWERKAQDKRRRDRENGVFERMTKRQQEEYAQQENKQRDQYVSRQLDELFNREYKPHVELKYVDEHGRRMDQREAFKQMSHQFHGKGSGKQKTEKRLKKIEDEKKREALSSLDSSQRTGMDNAMGTMGKRKGQAGVRLQ